LNVHRHEPAEFYFGLSGEGTVVAKGIEYRIAKGVAVFIPGNTDHGVVAGQGGLSHGYSLPPAAPAPGSRTVNSTDDKSKRLARSLPFAR
jgi:quercetin dioxygenase-like cupin family protein